MNRKDAKDRRRRRINISCSEEEYAAIHRHCDKSMSQGLNEYARKVLLEKPVVMVWRNVSLDALIEELNALRNKLALLETHNLGPLEIYEMNNVLNKIGLIADKITDQCIPN